MVDANTYKLLHPSNAPHEPGEELDSAVMESHKTPEYPFLYLLPSTIEGYGFHDKKWSKTDHVRCVITANVSHRRTPGATNHRCAMEQNSVRD